MIKTIKDYRLKIPSQRDNLEIIRNFVSSVARRVGFGDDDINKIELAVDEACTNVIQHAYEGDGDKHIDIAVKIGYEKFSVVVTDRGKSFDMEEVEMPDMKEYLAELRVGGLGIYLMRMLMDEVSYTSKPGGENEVRMVKYLLGDKK